MDKYNPYILLEEKAHLHKQGIIVRLYSTPFSAHDISKAEAKKLVIEDLQNGLIPENPDYRVQMCVTKDKKSWIVRFEIE